MAYKVDGASSLEVGHREAGAAVVVGASVVGWLVGGEVVPDGSEVVVPDESVGGG